MTAASQAHLEQELRAKVGADKDCASCRAAVSNIEIIIIQDSGAVRTVTVALPDACHHIAVGTPGSAPTQLTTTLRVLHQFLEGGRSSVELLLANDWSVNEQGATGSALSVFDELSGRLASSSACCTTVSSEPVVYTRSCQALSLSEVAATYRGRMLPEAWKALPAFDPAVALDGLEGFVGPLSFTLPLSPDLRSRGPLWSGLTGAGRRVALRSG